MTFFQQNSISNIVWHVICDFDGTISLKDTTDTLLNQFAHPDWEKIEQQWEQGLIGSKQCMQQQIALLDMTEQQLLHCLDQIKIDSNFVALVHLLEKQQVKLSIVSDGLDFVIQHILKKNQLDHLPIIANHLAHPTNTRWELSFPYSDIACNTQSGTCKCKVAQQNHHEKIILIGDGRSDFCLAEQADYVFAKKSLIDHCVNKNIQHHPFEDFSQLLEPLLAILNSPSQVFDATKLWVNS
ncbi:MtnX-like HAD-IB family phosphatase [Acinetobacter rudis]|uniref:2,3-diketo-5-methylthio-1-phosphopentane phosphatase n=1 Tax=Acinetobacter rudis CIP 110305 TaxID=421052 RepID=S3MWU8_9GAMM|nr:MtnX-like HAD-IB family phosphatase [Acinetobacter rudis]EPF70928.1 hypothetical protein F945_02691 [Acinetobacter rudis CIP 110305]